MNLTETINKLLYALKQKDMLYKINSFQAYNEKKDKYRTVYKVYKRNPVLDKYNEVETAYSRAEIVIYLVEEWNKVKDK